MTGAPLTGQALVASDEARSGLHPSGFDPSRGESICMRCEGPNPCWFAPNEVWNYVVGGPKASDDPGGFLCPTCFIFLAEAVGLSGCWTLRPVRGPRPKGPSRPRSTNPKKERVADEVLSILRERDVPLDRAALLEQLAARGIILTGKDPLMVLSTMLWRSKDKVVRTKQGYVPAQTEAGKP